MLTGDIGRLATLARDDRLATAELALFHPLKFMLASPAEDADEIIRRLGPEVWVEDKYDGIRAQLHKRGTDVRLYSRDLHDVSGQFPEIVEAARPIALGRRPRRRDPGLEGRPRPAVHQPPGAARAQATVRADPGRRARSSTSPSTPWPTGRGDDAAVAGPSSRSCARPCASAGHASTRSTSRRPPTAAGSSARTWPWPPTPTRSRRPSPTRAPGATRA